MDSRPSVKHVLGVLQWFFMLTEKILSPRPPPPPVWQNTTLFTDLFFSDPFPKNAFCCFVWVLWNVLIYPYLKVWLNPGTFPSGQSIEISLSMPLECGSGQVTSGKEKEKHLSTKSYLMRMLANQAPPSLGHPHWDKSHQIYSTLRC